MLQPEASAAVAPQALISTRVILGDRASFDVTAREYYANRAATGYDNIVRLDASFSVRVRKQNAITVKYLLNRRDASFPGQSSSTQSRETIGIFYTFMGHSRFGAVDWK
jgi:hypothetical protein